MRTGAEEAGKWGPLCLSLRLEASEGKVVASEWHAPQKPQWATSLPKKRSSMNVFGDRTAEEARSSHARSIDQGTAKREERAVAQVPGGGQRTQILARKRSSMSVVEDSISAVVVSKDLEHNL